MSPVLLFVDFGRLDVLNLMVLLWGWGLYV